VEIFKPYTARIHFYNPSKLVPKFGYTFPIEFGKVNSELDTQVDYTTISFTPSKLGKYKFTVVAFGELRDETTQEVDNILLGNKTLHLEVVDTSPKPAVPEAPKIEAVPIEKWG
jgi:hypothetical protein